MTHGRVMGMTMVNPVSVPRGHCSLTVYCFLLQIPTRVLMAMVLLTGITYLPPMGVLDEHRQILIHWTTLPP